MTATAKAAGDATTPESEDLHTQVATQLLSRLDLLEQCAESNDAELDLLSSWANTMHRALNALKKQVQFNTSKHHNNHLLVGGIYEYKKQDNCKAAIKFF